MRLMHFTALDAHSTQGAFAPMRRMRRGGYRGSAHAQSQVSQLSRPYWKVCRQPSDALRKRKQKNCGGWSARSAFSIHTPSQSSFVSPSESNRP